MMELCNSCPYPPRCSAMVHCIAGKIVGEAVVLAKPKPMQVLTTDGMAMTGVEEKVEKKKVKK